LSVLPFSIADDTMPSMAAPAALLLLPASRLRAATLLDTSANRPSMPDSALLAADTACKRGARRGVIGVRVAPAHTQHHGGLTLSRAVSAPHLALQVLDCCCRCVLDGIRLLAHSLLERVRLLVHRTQQVLGGIASRAGA
jgi:hypothetical protein